jgi:predicted HTH domain antitoxin
MSTIRVDLDDELTVLFHKSNQPVQEVVREFLVLELYRRGTISSGKAAQLLGMSRWEFIRHASRLGIPLFDMTQEEWRAERSRAESI